MKKTLLAFILLLPACWADGEPPLGVAPGAPNDPHDPHDPRDPRDPALPCNATGFGVIQPILAAKCGLCHGESPAYGAPMSLARYEDLQAPAYSDPSRRVHELLIERIRGEGGRPQMPPPPTAAISEDELMRIGAWSRGGAPDGDVCDAPALPQPPIDTEPDDPALEKISIVARGAAVRPNMIDEYGCFATTLRLAAAMHGVRVRPKISTPEAVHHILLFRDKSGTYPEQKYEGCAADTLVNENLELIHGWAPGGEDLVLPEEAGVRLEDGDQLMVQIHYNNPSEETYLDDSGMDIYATRTLRPNDATVVGIGPELFVLPGGREQTSWTGECKLNQEMHIFGINPHMHLLGTGSKLELVRGRETTVLFERHDFSFDSQQAYPLLVDLIPGDVLRATCYWDTTPRRGLVWFGEKTSDEMCYLFAAHYPPLGVYSCN